MIELNQYSSTDQTMKKYILLPLLAILSISPQANTPGDNQSVLTSDQAYKMLYRVNEGKLFVSWHIAPGYHLYKNKFEFTDGAVAANMPKGTSKHDAYYGLVELYSETLNLDVDISKVSTKSIFVIYQGCKLNVICHLPQKKEIVLPNNHRPQINK